MSDSSSSSSSNNSCDNTNKKMNTVFRDPKVVENVVHKHVDEVQPVVHKEVEQTHIHPKKEHTYENEMKPAEIHDTQETNVDKKDGTRKSTFEKLKAKFQ